MSNKVKVVVELEYEWTVEAFELGNIEEDVAKHIGQGMFSQHSNDIEYWKVKVKIKEN